jgi:hypothetical protein
MVELSEGEDLKHELFSLFNYIKRVREESYRPKWCFGICIKRRPDRL